MDAHQGPAPGLSRGRSEKRQCRGRAISPPGPAAPHPEGEIPRSLPPPVWRYSPPRLTLPPPPAPPRARASRPVRQSEPPTRPHGQSARPSRRHQQRTTDRRTSPDPGNARSRGPPHSPARNRDRKPSLAPISTGPADYRAQACSARPDRDAGADRAAGQKQLPEEEAPDL